MPLRSAVFSVDGLENSRPDPRLQACADLDASHIVPSSPGRETKGAFVSKIQNALVTLNGARIDQAEIDAGRFGPSTEQAVLDFKGPPRNILNFKNQIDGIVGKKTIKQLDDELFAAQDVPARESDMLIHLLGTPDPARRGKSTVDGDGFIGVASVMGFDQQVNTAAYLTTHFPIKHLQWFGGFDDTDPSDTVVAEIVKYAPTGVLFIAALSVAGPNLLKIGAALQGRGIMINYAAICDGAFDNAEESLRKAQFGPGIADNYYQSLSYPLDPRQEYHGEISGGIFRNWKLDGEGRVAAVWSEYQLLKAAGLYPSTSFVQNTIDGLHVAAVRDAYADVQRVILHTLRAPD